MMECSAHPMAHRGPIDASPVRDYGPASPHYRHPEFKTLGKVQMSRALVQRRRLDAEAADGALQVLGQLPQALGGEREFRQLQFGQRARLPAMRPDCIPDPDRRANAIRSDGQRSSRT